MKKLFAALRFSEDENIAGRSYWYLSEIPLKEGERVLAPIGSHDRLQCARVERLLEAEAENAPYDTRLIKCVAAKLGARKLTAGRIVCFEFGGVRYDEKRYTRFRRVLFTAFTEEFTKEEQQLLSGYGVTRILEAQEGCEAEIFGELTKGGCVLLAGTGARKTAENIIAAVRGERDCGYDFRKYLT